MEVRQRLPVRMAEMMMVNSIVTYRDSCSVVRVFIVERRRSSIDGEESLFGYCSMVNISRFEPQTEVAIVYDGKGFLAIVKRDPRTESFFG